ncbi:MAG: transporter, partial [Bacteroidota bacterium]|nr:transporter [Bacteroidota bacterium]
MKNYFFVLIVCLTSINNFSQISIVTEGTDIIDKVNTQIESNWTFNSDGGSLNNLFRIGIFKGIELRFSTNLINAHEGMTGLFPSPDNLEFGAKFKILDKKETLTKISFLSHLSISTEYSNNSGGLLNRILVSHKLSESFELAYNLGYNKYFEQDNGLLVYSFVMLKSFGNLGAFVEIFGDSYSNLDLGITYLIKENLQADISYGQGINNELSYLSIGAAWNFRIFSK